MAKITVKKNLIIFHKPEEWDDLFQVILRDFGTKMAISFVLRRELGFTVRQHTGLMSANSKLDPSLKYYEYQVHLDFYSEAAQTWFQLKYL